MTDPRLWTHGTWTVKPGHEDEFMDAWRALAAVDFGQSEPATLLRDRDRPNVFVSFSPWPDDEAVAGFRASDEFRAAQERMRDLLEAFEPQTLDEVTEP